MRLSIIIVVLSLAVLILTVLGAVLFLTGLYRAMWLCDPGGVHEMVSGGVSLALAIGLALVVYAAAHREE